MTSRIIDIINDIKPYHDGVREDTNLLEQGILDSLALMVLVAEIEAIFDIELEPEDLVPENFLTVIDIKNLIELKKN